MSEKESLIICNINLGRPRKLNDVEADLAWMAPPTLDGFYTNNYPALYEAMGLGSEPDSMTRLMAVLPHLAKYYGIDKDALLEAWTAEYGMAHLRKTL